MFLYYLIIITWIKTFYENIILGVIASIIAILLWELFLQIKRICKYYRLKRLLGFINKECNILVPIYPNSSDRGMIKYRNVYSFGHLFSLLNKINKEPHLIASNKQSEYQDMSDVIAIGGPISNNFVMQTLNDYKIDFKTVKKEEVNEFEQKILDINITGFKVGEKIFPANEKQEPAIILKLTKEITGQNRTIFLIFGYSAQGTASAAYYFKKEYLKLYRKFKNQKFYILIYVSRREGYKVYNKNFVDLTESLNRIN